MEITPETAAMCTSWDGIRHVIFDMDGCLYRCEGAQSFYDDIGFRLSKASSPEEYNQTKHSLIPGTRCSNSYTLFHGYGKSIMQYYAEVDRSIDQFPVELITKSPELRRLLMEMKEKGLVLSIFTNNTRKMAERILTHLDLLDCFETIFSASDVLHHPDAEAISLLKPSGTRYEHILNTLQAQPEHVLSVGDRFGVDLEIPASYGSQIVLALGAAEVISQISSISG